MIVPFEHVLLLAALHFLLGAAAVVARRNLIMLLLGVEVMFNAAALVLVAGSLRWMALDGQAFVLFAMGVAAAEVAVGLTLLVYVNRIATSATLATLAGPAAAGEAVDGLNPDTHSQLRH